METSKWTEEKVEYLVRDFNGIACKFGMLSRVKYIKKDNKYILLLGSEGQFNYGTYQGELCNGSLSTIGNCLNSMIMLLCFERNIG